MESTLAFVEKIDRRIELLELEMKKTKQEKKKNKISNIADRISELTSLKTSICSAAEEKEKSISVTAEGRVEYMDVETLVQNLTNLVFLGTLFDVQDGKQAQSSDTRESERKLCLQLSAMEESQIDNIVKLASFILSKKPEDTCHKDSLDSSYNHILNFLKNATEPISSKSVITYDEVMNCLTTLMESDYYSNKPGSSSQG